MISNLLKGAKFLIYDRNIYLLLSICTSSPNHGRAKNEIFGAFFSLQKSQFFVITSCRHFRFANKFYQPSKMKKHKQNHEKRRNAYN